MGNDKWVDESTGELQLMSDSPPDRMHFFNIVNYAIQQLPTVLEKMSDEELIEAYGCLHETLALRWKATCAILAEYYLRVIQHIPRRRGRDNAFKEIAQTFGIKKSWARDKVNVWLTFWQQEGSVDKVYPNDRTWAFEQLAHGQSYYVAALRAKDPIAAITEGEERYLEAIKKGESYSASRFEREVIAIQKPEEERLKRMSKTVGKAADTLSELSTRWDDSLFTVHRAVGDLEAIRDELELESGSNGFHEFSDVEEEAKYHRLRLYRHIEGALHHVWELRHMDENDEDVDKLHSLIRQALVEVTAICAHDEPDSIPIPDEGE